MKLTHEVLELIAKKKTKAEKVELLKQYETPALRDYIRGSMDNTIKWLVPDGNPPYTPCDPHNCPSSLNKQTRNLAYIVKGGPGEKMPAVKRENILIAMLETIDPNDALLVISMLNKKQPKGLTKAIIHEAYPGLLSD